MSLCVTCGRHLEKTEFDIEGRCVACGRHYDDPYHVDPCTCQRKAATTSQMESLFLDEGFGTLDDDTLEVMYEKLGKLGKYKEFKEVITFQQAMALYRDGGFFSATIGLWKIDA